MYDYVIIGAGPAGLAMAWYLTKYNKKILLIEKESTIGGCHRVRRVNGLFTEHGPRIVLDNYFSFIEILKEMDLKFEDLYTEYDFSVNVSTKKMLSILSYNELLSFAYEFGIMTFYGNRSKNLTMMEFSNLYGFKQESKDYIDVMCRLTDGGTIDNYTLFEFLQIFNQNVFYKIYQPKIPNDIGLFKFWQDALIKTKNVDIMFNIDITSIISSTNVTHIIANQNNKQINIAGSKYIFAIPPMPMVNIIKNSANPNMFGNIDDLVKWEKKSRYLTYIPINFHWNSNVPLKKVQGITESDYGIVYVVMSNYMKFNENDSKVVITCTIKATDRKSIFNNKTADECNEKELIEETFRQLKLYQPDLPIPTHSILSPGIYKKNNKWETIDTAYFYTKAGYKSNKSIYDNLFWIGSHNGNSNYSFTAMESAIENAISLLHDLEPLSKNDVKVYHPFKITDVIIIMIFCLIVVIIETQINKSRS